MSKSQAIDEVFTAAGLVPPTKSLGLKPWTYESNSRHALEAVLVLDHPQADGATMIAARCGEDNVVLFRMTENGVICDELRFGTCNYDADQLSSAMAQAFVTIAQAWSARPTVTKVTKVTKARR